MHSEVTGNKYDYVAIGLSDNAGAKIASDFLSLRQKSIEARTLICNSQA